MRTSVLRSGVAIVAVAVLASAWAAAGVIEPGLNHMKTQLGSVWDFELEPIEEEKFGPGSDPFDGLIYVITDTKVAHGEPTAFVNDKAGLPVEIVAMTLHSVEPVEVMFTDPDTGARVPKLYDVLVTPDPSAANAGDYKIARDPGGGSPDHGTILANGPGDPDPEPIPPDSFFDVCFDFEFIPHDGGEIVEVQRRDRVSLTANVPWSSVAPPPYHHDGAGGFFPGFGPPPGPLAPLQAPMEPQILEFQGQAFTWRLRLQPIPEPATVGLLALGGLALVRKRRVTR